MIFNKIDESYIQIYGEHNGMRVNGAATKVKVQGNQNKVWHYNLILFHEQKMIRISSNEKEGTLINEKHLRKRVEKVCETERGLISA